MKTYRVKINYHTYVEVEVPADNEKDAEDVALQMAEDDTATDAIVSNLQIMDTEVTETEDSQITDLITEEMITLTDDLFSDLNERNIFINSIFERVKEDYIATADTNALNPNDVQISFARVLLALCQNGKNE